MADVTPRTSPEFRAALRRDARRGWGEQPLYPRILAVLDDLDRMAEFLNDRDRRPDGEA